ncbi:MAG: hypothetical protein RJA98_1324 [Pseudomonadota bacterium]|jgi:hypothetical protein
MAHPLNLTRPLAQQLRAHGPALLAGAFDPHAELMALVWGPRFDRTHGLELVLRQAPSSALTLPAVLAAADHFDTLPGVAQQRLRRLILRHRALRLLPHPSAHRSPDAARISTHAPCPAD